MKKVNKRFLKRAAALLLAVLCVVGLIPVSNVSAADDTIELESFGKSENYHSAKLGSCMMHEMYFSADGRTITGFCADHGSKMSKTLVGQTWGKPTPVTDPTVKVFAGFFYSNSLKIYTDKAKSMGLEANWSSYVTWYMNAIVQAIIWRYSEGTLNNPVEDCAEEMMYVFNILDNKDYTSIDDEYGGVSFRNWIQTILTQGTEVWGDWDLYKYSFTGKGNDQYPADSIQSVIVGVPHEATENSYTLKIRKTDAADPQQGLAGAHFSVQSQSGDVNRDVCTGADGTAVLTNMEPGTYTVTEVDAPAGYTIDDPGPQYAVLPDGENNTVTVTFTDSEDPDDPPPEPASGSIRKVDADSPTTGLAGSVIKVEGVDNNFVGTYTTDEDGYLSEFPWDNLENGSYVATEVTPPEGYTLSPDPNKVRQTFEWDGVHDVALVFENDAKVKVQLKKQDESGRPIAGVVFNIFCDGQLIGSEATDAQGTITVAAVTEGLYSFVEVAPAEGYNKLTWPVIAHVDQATIQGGGTVTVTAVNHKLPGLRVEKVDRTTGTGLAGVTFRIWRDTELVGDFYTDANGQIYLDNLQPGTYQVQEVNSDDDHILDTSPQQVELKEGGGVARLVFFNDRKPGIHLVKVDSADLTKTIPNAKFSIKSVDGDFGPQEFTTGDDGTIDLSKLSPGAYVITELECPGYVIDNAQRIVQLDGNEKAEFVFTNSKLPSLKLVKTSSDGSPLEGVAFRLAKVQDGTHYLDRTTGPDGTITWEGLEPGVYSLVETATDSEHILDTREHHIELFPGKTSTIVLENQRRSNLTVHKIDADTGDVVPGTVFLVRGADGHSVQEVTTGPDGTATVENLLPGIYEIVEKSVPAPYLLDAESQLVTLYPNRDRDVYFENHKRPSIEIIKENSITHERLSNVRFQVWYASNDTETGEYNDLGVFTTDENGRIVLDGPANGLRDGWFRVKELEPPHGFAFKGSDTQEAFIPAGKGHTFLFQNVPLSALVAYKYDSISKAAIEGCLFELRYLGGDVSGTGGTVIGRYKTGANGSFTVTGLKAGYYICEEVESDGDHVIDSAPQSFYISGKDQDVVTLYFNNSPKGSVLVRKVSASDGSPLSDVEFLVTTSKGTVVGNANGKYVTDSSGCFLVEGIDPGTSLVIKETRAKPGYLLDDTAQTTEVKAGVTVTLEFRDQPEGGLIVHKLSSTDRKTPLEGVQFKITYADGSFVDNKGGQLSSNGLYFTDENGQIVLDGVTGTLIVTEVQTIPGYTIDPARQSQTVVINPDGTQELWFYNAPTTALVLEKYIEGTTTPLKNVTFLLTDSSGAAVGNSNGEYITDENGRVVINGLVPGTTVTARETKVPDGFVLDATPKSILIKSGEPNVLRFYNKAKGTLVLLKKDSVTKLPVYGAKFQLTYADGSFVDYDNGHMSSKGLYTTDEYGEIRIYGVVGTVVAKELEAAPGYVIDPKTQTQTVVVGPDDTQTLVAYNEPLCSLTITKLDSQTHKPVPNTEFTVTDGNGNLIGRYVTGEDGTVTVTGLVPGTTVVVRESKVPRGYVLDTTPKTIIVRNGSNSVSTGDGSGGSTGTGNDLFFENDRTVSLVLEKYIEGTTTPIKGVTFLVTDSSGAVVGNSNGEYITDENGRVVINDLVPGTTVTARETKVPDGFVLDTTPKSILIKSGEPNVLRFYNKATGTLVVLKLDKKDKSPLAGVEFEITYSDGSYVDADYGHLSSKGLYKTDTNGEIRIPGVVGTVIITETKPLDGYTVDEGTRTQTVKVNPGDTQTVVVYNTKGSSALIHKVDSVTGKGIYGVTFLLSDANGNPVGTYQSDNNGYVYIDKELTDGRYTIREIECAEGYILDTQPKTIYIEYGGCKTVEWKNTPITGQIQIYKYAAEANPVTGTPAGAPLKGAVYEITEEYSGKVVEYITSDARGVAASNPLPLGRYKIVEVTAPAYWQIDPQIFDVTLRYSGQIIKLSAYDKPSNLGVTLTKTGNAQVLTGNQMWYTFTVANTSNVDLESFYWHERVPTDAVHAATLVTGTYSFRLNYRILYKTNFTADYQVLASNLLTTNNYSFNLNALPKQTGEVVTDIYFDFGKVPSGFQSSSSPKLSVVVLGTLADGYKIVNRADAGGKYQGTWQNATASWVTIVRKLTSNPTLPKTGF